MADWWRDQFNSWFGSNETHVANAYSHSDCIWLCFQREKLTIDQVSINTNSSSVILNNKKMKEQLLKVPFNEVHKQRRYTSSEFLTVFAKDLHGNVITICENYEIPANRSYIVTDRGGIKESVYGGNLWEDYDGHYHKT